MTQYPLYLIFVMGLIISCAGEEQGLPLQKGGGGSSGSQWLIRSWSGLIKFRDGNGSLNLAGSEIGMVFFPDQSFQLTRKDHPDDIVRGAYQLKDNNTLDLKVSAPSETSSLVRLDPGTRTFKMTKSANRLNLKGGNLEFDLQEADDASEHFGAGHSGSLYQPWICQNSASFWKVNFLPDSDYLLKLYTPDEEKPLLIIDEISDLKKETPWTFKLDFLRHQRRVTMEFEWNPDQRSLTGVVYSGTLRPASPGSFYCRSG